MTLTSQPLSSRVSRLKRFADDPRIHGLDNAIRSHFLSPATRHHEIENSLGSRRIAQALPKSWRELVTTWTANDIHPTWS